MNRDQIAEVMPDELLPCPFCGGRATVARWFSVKSDNRPDWWVASCVFGCAKSSEEFRREFAVAVWNKRVPAPPAIMALDGWEKPTLPQPPGDAG